MDNKKSLGAEMLKELEAEAPALTEAECQDRVAPPVLYQKEQIHKTREKVLQQLLHDLKGN